MVFLYNLIEYNIEIYFVIFFCYWDSGIDIIILFDVD